MSLSVGTKEGSQDWERVICKESKPFLTQQNWYTCELRETEAGCTGPGQVGLQQMGS